MRGRKKGHIRLKTEKLLAQHPKTSTKQLTTQLQIKPNYAKKLKQRIQQQKGTQLAFAYKSRYVKKLNNNTVVSERVHNSPNRLFNHFKCYPHNQQEEVLKINSDRLSNLKKSLENISDKAKRNHVLRKLFYGVKCRIDHKHGEYPFAMHLTHKATTRFLSEYFGFPMFTRIIWKNSPTHQICFDLSGLDICHYDCFDSMLDLRLKGYCGIDLASRLGKKVRLYQGNKKVFEKIDPTTN